MGLFVTWTIGLVLWIVVWAIGGKGSDAFLITLLLLLIGVVGNLVVKRLPGRSAGPQAPDDPAPFT
jgi:hypothetical protein